MADQATKQAAVKMAQQAPDQANSELASAQQSLTQASQKLTAAKAELQKEQDTLKLFTEVIQQVQTKVNTAQKKANETAQVVRNAKLDLAEANAKLADAKMTDAQRYGKQVVVNPVNITAGDPVPAPKLANALTLPVSRANGVSTLSLVVNNGQAAELPAGTTTVWANEAQVKADAQQAGNYTEDVLVTFPDGSQVTAKAQMKVVAAKVAHQNSNAVISSSSKNGSSSTMTTSYTEGYESGSESSQNEFNGVNGNLANVMTRGAYKASQGAKKGTLPQTGNDNSTLATVGLALASVTIMFGLKKRENQSNSIVLKFNIISQCK